MLWISPMGRPGNVLGKSRMNLPGTSLELQIRTSPGLYFRTSSRWSNRIFSRRHGDLWGRRTGDVLGTNICWLDCLVLVITCCIINKNNLSKVKAYGCFINFFITFAIKIKISLWYSKRYSYYHFLNKVTINLLFNMRLIALSMVI